MVDSLTVNGYSNPSYYQMLLAQQSAGAASTPVDTTKVSTPSFQGTIPRAQEKADSSVPAALLTTGVLAVGAATCILTKGKGKVLSTERWKTGWDAIKKDWFGIGKKASEGAGATRNVKPLVTGAQEYTLMKDGITFVMKDGKPIKIVTRDKKVITDATKISDWLKSNTAVKNEINSFTLSGKLPKNVSLSYTKVVGNYKITVEKGKVVKVMSKDSAGKYHEVKELDKFIKNHSSEVKEATALTRNLSSQKVKILNKHGKLVEKTGNLEMTVRDGQVVSAKFNGKELNAEELKALSKDKNSLIKNFDAECGNSYAGLSDYEYVYRQKGGQVFRFDRSKNVTSITEAKEVTHTTDDAIKKFFEKNNGIKDEIDAFASSGNLTEGLKLIDVMYKTTNGHQLNIVGNKIKSLVLGKDITINGKTFKAGDTISGKDLKKWQEIAENKNEIEKILEVLA